MSIKQLRAIVPSIIITNVEKDIAKAVIIHMEGTVCEI